MMTYGIKIDFYWQALFTFIMFISFFMLFFSNHKWFGTGFYIGVLWFWWIGLSFRYYGLAWMMPFIDILIGVFYGFVFWLIGKLSKYKFLLLLIFVFAFDYLRPFTFDWLKPEVLFVNSYYLTDKLTLFTVLFSIIYFRKLKYFSFLLLAVPLFFHRPSVKMPKLNIMLASTFIPQNLKWQKNYIPVEIDNNIHIIKKAITLKKDAVVLPESSFPLFLNLYPGLMNELKRLSKRIVIVAGALHYKNKKYYNSAYVFENGGVKILDKHLLVPFGEYIPVPFFQKEINKIFFGDASDYSTAKKFGIYKIKKYKFINAICYEATAEDLYKLKPEYVIAITNDAWFYPSIEASLQKMLIKIYAQKYKKIIFHTLNMEKSYIVKP